MYDDELEHFKKTISIEGYAVTLGFYRDVKECSQKFVCLRTDRRGAGEKIIICNTEGIDIYRNERDLSEHGTIIDFVQNQLGLSLGHVRVELRKFIGSERVETMAPITISADTPINRIKITSQWDAARLTTNNSYLRSRGITFETMAATCFVDTYRVMSGSGDILFPHRDREGITGFEIRAAQRKMFSKGGRKALWYTPNIIKAKRIVICEGAIDCLSFHQVNSKRDDTAYVSFAGGLGSYQIDLLTGLFVKSRLRGQDVIVATDNDAAGHEYFKRLSTIDGSLQRAIPVMKDWNEDIKLGNAP